MSSKLKNTFEDEIFYNLTKQRNKWASVAVASMVTTGISLFGLILILPLKEVKPYVIMVNKTTGEAEKIVEVQPATLTQQDAVLQAELVSYISDRETFDRADNEQRIDDVLELSAGAANESLVKLWKSSHPDHPPTLYPKGVRITVLVNSISLTPKKNPDDLDVAIVNISKTREELGSKDITRYFQATISYKFEPKSERLEKVWKNPLGFKVLDYRLDAVTLGGQSVSRQK